MKDICLAPGCGHHVAYVGDHFCSGCECYFCHGDATQAESFEDSGGRRFCNDECNRLWHGFQRDQSKEPESMAK